MATAPHVADRNKFEGVPVAISAASSSFRFRIQYYILGMFRSQFSPPPVEELIYAKSTVVLQKKLHCMQKYFTKSRGGVKKSRYEIRPSRVIQLLYREDCTLSEHE